MIRVNLSSPRTLLVLASLLVVLVGVQFLLFPFLDELQHLKQNTQEQQRTHTKLQGMITQLHQLRSKGQGVKEVKIRSLPAWLEKKTVSAGLKSQVKQISPVPIQKGDLYQQKTTLRMEGLEMKPLLDFIVQLEKTAGLRVIRSHLKRGTEKKPGLSFFIELGVL